MPPLAIHTAIAREMADELRLPALDGERGNLYLGSTAPDIRVITRWERRRTHFFDLDNFDEQSGVQGFFESNPALAEAGNLAPRTQAFVAGFLSHLVVDEIWIGAIYRPFFGERSPLGGGLRANVMDRALQFQMDADKRRDPELMAHVLEAVARCDLDLELDFIDRETLERWQGVIRDYTQQEPDWERFAARGARRHLEPSGQPTNGNEYAELVRSLPDLVDETLAYLSRERVDDVINGSLQASVQVVKGYLNGEE